MQVQNGWGPPGRRAGLDQRPQHHREAAAVVEVPVGQEHHVDVGQPDAQFGGVVEPEMPVGADIEEDRVARRSRRPVSSTDKP